ncbi:hypothetical protein RFI_37876 [Reticulomyxa filosa]|uniref:Uncharacterized protein n=1 Tax=Reticulomyxa filosa TaxID=46433 RepID=X6LEP0_RETFI|nr:hypothetical protein RFI_37876 [Reticulomyxa filosa]|eukprot:ETN99596.1 hypothetical protein RFI_37876 [Reticulomyxa filosa]
MECVENLGKFDDDKDSVIALLRSAFWLESRSSDLSKCLETNLSKKKREDNGGKKKYFLLSFKKMSVVVECTVGATDIKINEARLSKLKPRQLYTLLRVIGTPEVIRHIFDVSPDVYLQSLSFSERLDFLECPSFYSDRFAKFVFDNSNEFLKQPVQLRMRFLKGISIECLVDLMKNGNIGRRISNSELLGCVQRLKIQIKLCKQAEEEYKMLPLNQGDEDDFHLKEACDGLLNAMIRYIVNVRLSTMTLSELKLLMNEQLIADQQSCFELIKELFKRNEKLAKQALAWSPNIDARQEDEDDESILSNENLRQQLIGVVTPEQSFARFEQIPTQTPVHDEQVFGMGFRQQLLGPLVVMPLIDTRKIEIETVLFFSYFAHLYTYTFMCIFAIGISYHHIIIKKGGKKKTETENIIGTDKDNSKRKIKKESLWLCYWISVQIQNLEVSRVLQHCGVYVLLLHSLPSKYQIKVSCHPQGTMANLMKKISPMNIGDVHGVDIGVLNPNLSMLCVPWPLPTLGKLASFEIRAICKYKDNILDSDGSLLFICLNIWSIVPKIPEDNINNTEQPSKYLFNNLVHSYI